MKSLSIKNIIWMMFICIMIIIIDQATKYLAVNTLSQSVPIYTFFSLTLTFNRGISFGMFNGQQQLLLIAVAVVIIIGLILMLIFMQSKNIIIISAIAMIVAGSIGNIIDRIIFGAVVDFLDFHYLGYYFPVFNVADSAICLGAAIMVYGEYKLPNIQKK